MSKNAKIKLSDKEKSYLSKITKTGKNSAITIKKAFILLKSDEGLNNSEISKALDINDRFIQRVRKKYREKGLEVAIFRKQRKDANSTKLDGEQEAKIIQIACSKPPDGYAKWSLRMLADKTVELEIIDSISHETIRKTLKKMNLNLT